MRSKKIDLAKANEFKARPVLEGIAIGLLILISIAASASFLYFQAVDAVKAEIREGVLRSVTSLAATVDGDEHQKFMSKEQKFDADYLEFVAPLERARQAAKYVPYIYTNIMKEGKVYFIANPSPQLDLDGDGFPDDAPDLMDSYDAPSASLLAALKERKETVDQEPYSDQWGTFISAYAPIYTKRGDFVGTLGMDLDFSGFEKRLMPTKNAFKTAAITGVVMAVLVGITVWYNRRIVKQLNASRYEIAEKFAEANEYVHQTNLYRSNLIHYLASSLERMDQTKHHGIFHKLRLIAALEKDDYTPNKANFSLQKTIDEALTLEGMSGRVKLNIASNVPDFLFGEGEQLKTVMRYLFSTGMDCPISEIKIGLEKETLHEVTFKAEFLADKDKANSEWVDQFCKSLTVLETSAEKPLLQAENDLHAAIAHKMLTQMGAKVETKGAYPKVLSFTLKLDKYLESQVA